MNQQEQNNMHLYYVKHSNLIFFPYRSPNQLKYQDEQPTRCQSNAYLHGSCFLPELCQSPKIIVIKARLADSSNTHKTVSHPIH